MASCPKCNHRPLKKHPDGTRRCPRHGVVTPNTFLTVGLACLALVSCQQQVRVKPVTTDDISYIHDRNGNCFAIIAFQTYAGYRVGSITTVPCERAK